MIKQKLKICIVCKKPKYIFSKGRCRECVTYKPIERGTKQPNRVSKSQKTRTARYLVLRDQYMSEHPICQVCNIARSTELHHKRGRVGNNLFQDLLAVCRDCHHRIEVEPAWARENEYSLSRI